MVWWGKLLGGTFGFLSAGPLGAIVGFAAGHTMAAGWIRLAAVRDTAFAVDPDQLQRAFFEALFPALGHVAKADGRVSPDEIQMVEAVIAQMALSPAQRAAAIRLFNQGKQPDFARFASLDEFKRVCQGQRLLLRLFVEVLLQAAYADGSREIRKREAVKQISSYLGISRFEFTRLDTLVRTARARDCDEAGSASSWPPDKRAQSLDQDYALLDIPSTASDDEVKRAYRRQMNQHHPDKLASKGLSENAAQRATQRTQQIHGAYHRIRKARRLHRTPRPV